MNKLLISFYGDDFTGSVDVLETLTVQGVKSALFLEAPTEEILEGRFEGIEAIGVAGISRSLAVDEMEAELRPKFKALKQLGAPIVHYKTCSTFDSSPKVGNIGRAIEIGMDVLGANVAPLALGTPHLKRFVVFGNLFASIGEETYRIDRHPMMSRHPITPMDEADIGRHLAKQTDIPVELIDSLKLRGAEEALCDRFETLMTEEGRRIIVLDTIVDSELPTVGKLLSDAAKYSDQAFVVGSSGVEYSLAAYWQEKGGIEKLQQCPALEEVNNLFVMSGSASPATREQIEYAEKVGFRSVRVDTVGLMNPEFSDAITKATEDEIIDALRSGESVVAYAARGPDDPSIAATRKAAEEFGSGSAAHRLSRIQGLMMKRIMLESGIRRACVAGGDTSGFACKELAIFALQVAAIIAPGTPICSVMSESSDFDGLELALKSGQLGGEKYFEFVRLGRPVT